MNTKYLLLAAVGLALIILGWWFIKDGFLTEGPLRTYSMQPVPGEVKFFYDKLLLVRRESANGPLLLKVLNEDLVVRYGFDTRQVQRVQVADWHAASGRITICGDGFPIPEEDETGKYNSYGKYARLGAYSKDQSKLAMISAAGPKGPSISLIPGLGGGPAIYGSRYLEIKSGVHPFTNLQIPIRVVDESGMSLCWTEEQDTLVYFSRYTFRFSIVPLAGSTLAQPTLDTPRVPDAGLTRPDLSRFTGKFRDYGIDADGDGLYEKIAIEIETETSMPGRYKIHLGLQASNGSRAGQGVETELKGGIEMTKVIFDADEWSLKDVEGELLITNAHLDYGDGPNIEIRESLGRTRKFSRDQFKRENIVFTNEHEYKLVDPSEDGRFRGLEFTVGVDVLEPGEYEWSADLYFEKWLSTADGIIEFLEGKSRLKKGKNQLKLKFSAESIIKYGKPGRFELRNVLIYRKGEQGKRLESLPLTRPFELSEFAAD